MNKEQKKKLFRLGVPMILGAILLLGVSYAYLSLTLTGTKSNVIKAGTLSLVLDDKTSSEISIQGAVPMLDEVGQTQNPYTFTLTNNGDVESEYTIYLDDLALESNETRLQDGVIKYNLVKDENNLNTALLSSIGSNPNRILDSGVIGSKESYTYDLRLWLDENMTIEDMGKVFKGKLKVLAEQVKEKEPTQNECFVFSNGSIKDYLCTAGNSQSLPVITEVVIPRTIENEPVTNIGNRAFEGNGLLSVTIPDTVKRIEGYAFYRNNITKVDIPSSVSAIAGYAFMNNKINSLTLHENLVSIEHMAFAHNQLTHIEIPKSVKQILVGTFNDNKLSDDQAFIYARKTDGTEDKTILVSYGGIKRNDVVIPEGVKIIKDSAMRSNGLLSVTIPNSVTTIENKAFENNSLTKITIPKSVNNLGFAVFNKNKLSDEDAFIYNRKSDGSEDLTSLNSYAGAKRSNIVIPSNIKVIGRSSFSEQQLTGILTIPSTVTSIEYLAFGYNQLTDIILPSSIKSIGELAFTSNQLKRVTIQGKSSSAEFDSYPSKSPFGWASSYSDANIIWQP